MSLFALVIYKKKNRILSMLIFWQKKKTQLSSSNGLQTGFRYKSITNIHLGDTLVKIIHTDKKICTRLNAFIQFSHN